ncbi:MAG TPA: cupin domain-containing protein [Bellilinea sp.]|nr:cupin domain-containing protein [Bellilinea sp.]
MLKRKNELNHDTKENLRGGSGKVQFEHLLNADDTGGRIKMAALLTFEPGVSVGEHAHVDDAELYWMVDGEMTATDGDLEVTFRPGDVIWTADGASHSLRNDSTQPARLLAIILK